MINDRLKFPIDFVVTWVDDSDKDWQIQKQLYSDEENDDKSGTRFRDTGLFKYWFRSVEKYTPWVNHVYLVTNGQVPKFLDMTNDKITLIDHKDIIPANCLPTFNSNAIELAINKIPGLMEHFVVFNDDVFVNRPLKPIDFFSEDGLPKDTAGLNQIMPVENFDHITANNISIINQQFNKKEVMKKQKHLFFNIKNGPLNIYTALLYFFPRFSRFYDLHIAYSFKKSLFDEFVTNNKKLVEQTMGTKFRAITDISLWGLRYYQIVTGNISVRKYNFGKFYTLNEYQQVISDIRKGTHGIIDINDAQVENIDAILTEIKMSFQKSFSEKSQYEK